MRSITIILCMLAIFGLVGRYEYQLAKQDEMYAKTIQNLRADLLNEKRMHETTHYIHEKGVELLRQRRVQTDMTSGEFISWVMTVLTGHGLEEHAENMFVGAE